MVYTRFRPQWRDGQTGGTPIIAAALDHIEAGVEALNPPTTTDLEALLTSDFLLTVPSTQAAGPDQTYRAPTAAESRSVINGMLLLDREAGQQWADVSTADAAAVLLPHGMTVSGGHTATAGRPYALVRSEATYPVGGSYRAWGWYVLDLSQPVSIIVSAPHPQTDGNSEFIALRYAQRVPGALLALSSVNRKAKDWLVTEVSTDHTGGTYTLTFRGQTTTGIAPGASTATIQTAVTALSTVGAGNVTVTGDPANTANHAFINLAGSLWNSASPTDTITVNAGGLTGGTYLTLDHDADVAHNHNAALTKVTEAFARLGLAHVQLHGYADVSSGVPRIFSGILSRGSSNNSVLIEAARTALEAQGFDIALRDSYDTQGLYLSGTPTGGTYTLACDGQTTGAIGYSATLATLASNVRTALAALSSIGAGNVAVTVSQNANGSIPALVITFAGALYHSGKQITVATNSLTGTGSPTPVPVSANTTGLTAQSNAQGDIAEANGTPFLHLELAATVRDSATSAGKVVDALAAAGLPALAAAAMPLLAETGHTTSQSPLVNGAAATTGTSPIAARADHRHPATTNTPAGNDLLTRNAGNTGWAATSPDLVAATMTTVMRTSNLTTGEAPFSRDLASSSAIGVTSGQLRLTYFTARKSETTTQVRVTSGTTAAGATPTLVRVGLYLIDGAGDGTLVASTANDTTLFAAPSTAYTKAWSAPVTKIAGQRYAWGILVITAAAAPTFPGYNLAAALDAESAVDPRLAGRLTSLSDLPTNFVTGSLSTTINRFYGVILP